MKPPNKGHTGVDHFVHYREVVLYLEVKMYCYYIGWCIRKCPLYRGARYSECPLSEVPLYKNPPVCVAVDDPRPPLWGIGDECHGSLQRLPGFPHDAVCNLDARHSSREVGSRVAVGDVGNQLQPHLTSIQHSI